MKITRSIQWVASLAVLAALHVPAAWSQTELPAFPADGGISGSSLTGWTPLGHAAWTARDGVVTAQPKTPEGGWLVLGRSLSNIGFYTRIRCAGDCKAGVLLRAEKTADGGMKGLYVALSDSDRGVYALTVDAQGRDVSRVKLPSGASFGGLSSPHANTPPEIDALQKIRNTVLPSLRAMTPQTADMQPLNRPTGDYLPGAWNSLNIFLFQDAFNPSVNGGVDGTGALTDVIVPADLGTYGRIALYAGGTKPAQFSGVAWKDLLKRERPAEYLSSDFEMHRLDGLFYSWSPAVGDFNHDGHPDIAAGPWIYFGPDFTKAQEYYTPVAYNPTADYPQLSTVAFAHDFTGDGWDDIIQFTGNAGYITGWLYVNPKGQSRHWDKYKVLDLLANEDTELVDLFGDGKVEILHGGPDYGLGYSMPDPKDPTGKWIITRIAPKGPWGDFLVHGLGAGDINGDGRKDIISPFGWWEQPPPGTQGYWKYHPFAFTNFGISQGGPGGSTLGVYDVNGDGLNDVVTAQQGHGFGLAWFEQKRDAAGNITFVRHWIMNNWLDKNAGGVTFTELHAIGFADMDGDGIPDIVTGKRSFSHLDSWHDPDPWGQPVLYIYKTVRDPHAPGGARFVPEMIHNFSGVGAHIELKDMNGDGLPDIETSGPYGTFVFINRMKQGSHRADISGR
ncbi:FG-GAP-like repeat-containing protein [Paracidobacterium acidisoli]|nr:FG-GAP-like repeat-containing protein [Paracidobacterium acidisoli]MBT9333230.1 VCBS repeat-containing protein [Paracidobacterium acidisoli]